MTQHRPWRRLPEETAKAHSAFVLYMDMGEGRTVERVQAALNKSSGYLRQLYEWSSVHRWIERVRAYDEYVGAAARRKIEADTIKRRAEIISRHALTGKVLQQRGIKYLEEHGIEKSSDAISAIVKGISLERAAENLPEYLVSIVEAPDDELMRQYADLLASLAGSADETPDSDANDEYADGRIIKLG